MKTKYVFMHRNAPPHVANGTHQFFKKKKFLGKSQMIWPPASPDLTLIKNRERRRFLLVRSVSGSMKIIKADLWDARYSNSV